MPQDFNAIKTRLAMALIFFSLENFGEIAQKVLSTCTYNGAEKHVTCEHFEMPLPGQRLTPSLLCTLLMMTSVFMTPPECLFVKPQSRALTARELPC